MRGRRIFAGSAAVVLAVMMTLSPAPVRAAEPQELSLPEAVRRLERVNPSIQSAVRREKAAERGVWEARSGFLPSISLSGDITQTEEPNLVTPMREEPSPMSDSELEFEEKFYTGVARVDVPIVNLPAIGRAETARKSARLEAAERDALEQSLIAAVMEVYVQARQIEDSLSLIDASIAALKRRREELIDLREEGRVPRSEVTELESRLDARRADRLQLTGRQEELSYRLAELLDLDGPVSPSRAAFAAPQPHDAGPAAPASGAADPASSVGAPASAGGPKIEAAKAQVAAARAGRRTAGYAFAPRVSGFYAETARSGPDLDFSTEWSAGVTMTISLLIGGERAARFATAAAELEAARSGRQAAELEHTRELRTAARSYELAAERRRLTERAVSNRERSLEAAQDRYEEGRASLGEMLDEERALLELEIAERTLLYEQVLASIAYYRTTGELTVDFARKLIEE